MLQMYAMLHPFSGCGQRGAYYTCPSLCCQRDLLHPLHVHDKADTGDEGGIMQDSYCVVCNAMG
jgi:hypothetical protein